MNTKTQIVRWKGVFRDRTDKFKSFKSGSVTQISGGSSQENSREMRFKRISNSIMNLADDDDLEQPKPIKQVNDLNASIGSGEQTLEDDAGVDVRDRKLSSTDTSVSYKVPFWILCKDEIDENVNKIEKKFEKLKNLERKRVNEIFKKGEVDEVQYLIMELTQDIRTNEEKLMEIKKYKPQSEADEKIKANVEIVVAKRLQELTHSLRQRQRKYVAKIKELNGGEESKINLSDDEDQFDEELEVDEIEAYRAKHRDKEIQELTDSVRDLAILFKELSVLVIEQGTVIDRIDYNIEIAMENTKKGKKHLEGARKAQKSNRSRKVIICLSILILMFITLLI